MNRVISILIAFIALISNLSPAIGQVDTSTDLTEQIESCNSHKISIETFECKRDNLTIRGTAFIPKGKDNCPIAIISHGFMANQLFSFVHAQYLARMGYAAFCFDFCGGTLIGASDGKSTQMSVMTEVMDLKAVINYAKSLPYTDENNLFLIGCSQGGFVSAITASQLKEQVKGLILLYPALSIPDDARNGHMMFAKFDPNNVPDTFYCGPMKLSSTYVTDVIDLDPYEIISKYKGNVLILHGDNDNIVDITYSEKALEAYTEAGANAEFEIIEGGGHMFFNPCHAKTAIKYIKAFINKIDK